MIKSVQPQADDTQNSEWITNLKSQAREEVTQHMCEKGKIHPFNQKRESEVMSDSL